MGFDFCFWPIQVSTNTATTTTTTATSTPHIQHITAANCTITWQSIWCCSTILMNFSVYRTDSMAKYWNSLNKWMLKIATTNTKCCVHKSLRQFTPKPRMIKCFRKSLTRILAHRYVFLHKFIRALFESNKTFQRSIYVLGPIPFNVWCMDT